MKIPISKPHLCPFQAAFLYYLAELIEEYTTIAKKVITIIVLFVTTVYLLFMFFDNLPWSMVICGLVSQALHAIILTDFPYVKLMSVQFIGAVVMLFVNHYLAFNFFTQRYFNFTEVIEIFSRICTHILNNKMLNFSGSRLFYNLLMDHAIRSICIVERK